MLPTTSWIAQEEQNQDIPKTIPSLMRVEDSY